jgi:L-asparaginase
MDKKRKVLLIYTGGTIGMQQNPKTNALQAVNFEGLKNSMPELKNLQVDIDVESTSKSLDSSDLTPTEWQEMATIIQKNYKNFDGFVILHGSDTMSFTASALSFMTKNLNKPIILTGAQLPMGVARTDAKENLITAIEIASTYKNNRALVPEVAVYFEYKLYRGNRVTKVDAQRFNAFASYNYPAIAEAGVNIQYFPQFIDYNSEEKDLIINTDLETQIATIKIFPGVNAEYFKEVVLNPTVKGIVIETFGAGNLGNKPKWIDLFQQALAQGKIIVNISQCLGGSVEHGKYAASSQLEKIGVIEGGEMTYEAAVCKLMHVLALPITKEEKQIKMQENIRGEK